MAYLPETKDKTPRVSPAAQRVLGSEDPRARKEVEAQKNQKFSTWDEISVAADMLPGGAMAVRGGRQIAEAVLSAVQSGTVQDAMKLAANAAKTDKDVLRQALQHLDRAFTEAKRVKQEGAEAVYTAAKNSIEAVLDRTLDVRGRAKSVEHKAAKETMRREGREPSTLGQSTSTAGSEKGVQASETTKALVPAQDVDSMVLQFEKIAGSKEVAPEAVTDQLIKATEGDVSKLNAMLKKTEILEEEVFRAGGTHPSDLTIRGLRNLVMALHKAISNVSSHLAPSSSRIKSIPPTSGNRLNLPGGPLYGGPPPPQP